MIESEADSVSGPDAAPRTDAYAEAQAALAGRRDAILLAALPDVAFDGWTWGVLHRAAEVAGFPVGEAEAAFPGGPVEAVCWFSQWADRQMAQSLAETDLKALKVRERVTLAVRRRLEVLVPYREAVRRAGSLLALPLYAGRAPQLVYDTVDAAWRAVGDGSTDYNFYTKRLLLAGVVTSTTLYWLDDRSEGLSDSWAFLDRRIANVMTVGQGIGRLTGRMDKVGTILSHIPSPARFMRRLRGAATR